jgi:hypothetical protein
MSLKNKVASILAAGLLVASCGTADPDGGDTNTTLPDITTTAPTGDTSTTETTEGETTTTEDTTTTTAN